MAAWLTALAGSYLLGSIPTAYLVVKRLKRVDIRSVGSGNVGATNVTRSAGFGPGLFVFVIDGLKGWAAVSLVAPALMPDGASAARLACGVAAVAGHMAPVFLRFRGGKGVATSIGVLLGAMPSAAAVFLGVWVVCFALWRYVSVGSLAAAVSLPAVQLLAGRPIPDVLLGAGLAALIIVKHRANIERLLQGREHRVGRPSPSPPG